jgi:hypothetical protein
LKSFITVIRSGGVALFSLIGLPASGPAAFAAFAGFAAGGCGVEG